MLYFTAHINIIACQIYILKSMLWSHLFPNQREDFILLVGHKSKGLAFFPLEEQLFLEGLTENYNIWDI